MHRKGHRKYRTEIRNYSLMGWMYIRKRVLNNLPMLTVRCVNIGFFSKSKKGLVVSVQTSNPERHRLVNWSQVIRNGKIGYVTLNGCIVVGSSPTLTTLLKLVYEQPLRCNAFIRMEVRWRNGRRK